MFPSLRALAGAVLCALAIAACGTVETTPPAPTPADFGGIIAEFAKRGVVVSHAVSGDAGCKDPVLIPTAIGFDAKGLDQAATVRIYLYIFNNRAAFERLRPSVDDCARSFVTDPQTYQSIDQSPFVVTGQGPWGPSFEKALRDGLAIAAGSGG
ncbi:MAG: hypothetical protein QOJ75_1330 [Chloroflexota bacterium]|nr:hypothetical protein [Chloroflexota bacterium]